MQDAVIWSAYRKYGRREDYWKDYWFYAVIALDQFLHLACIMAIAMKIIKDGNV
jgi:hypothetical protein